MSNTLPREPHTTLGIPADCSGRLWRHSFRDGAHSRHTHAEIEMNLAYCGAATYLVGQQRYRMAPGAMLWLFPSQDHVLIDQSPDFHMWLIVVRPSVASALASRGGPEYAALAEDDPPGCFVRLVGSKEMDSLLTLFEQIDAFEHDAVSADAAIEYATAASWLAFLHATDAQGIGLHPAVERAVWLLRDDEPSATVESLAREAGLSPSRLSRLFHAQVGVPIASFRNSQRLDRFNRLLARSPRINLAAAVLDAGFGSYAQFYRVYRAAYGHGPRAAGSR